MPTIKIKIKIKIKIASKADFTNLSVAG